MPLFAAGTIEPLIDARFALKDAAEAHTLMEQGGHFGKIILSNQE
jgi:NADPH2:quinone reductase